MPRWAKKPAKSSILKKSFRNILTKRWEIAHFSIHASIWIHASKLNLFIQNIQVWGAQTVFVQHGIMFHGNLGTLTNKKSPIKVGLNSEYSLFGRSSQNQLF